MEGEDDYIQLQLQYLAQNLANLEMNISHLIENEAKLLPELLLASVQPYNPPQYAAQDGSANITSDVSTQRAASQSLATNVAETVSQLQRELNVATMPQVLTISNEFCLRVCSRLLSIAIIYCGDSSCFWKTIKSSLELFVTSNCKLAETVEVLH